MRSAKKEIKKMPLRPITEVKPSKDMSYSHSNQPTKALSTPAGSRSSENKSKDKSKNKDKSKKGVDKKILGEAVGAAGAALGQAISNLGTSGAPPENYVSKVFARRSGFKMKYNKNNFPFKK